MKTILALAALASLVPVPQGPPPGGPPPQSGGAGPSRPASQGGGRGTTGTAGTTTTETIRVLALGAVQKDLGITAGELRSLATIADGLSRTSATEDAAFAAASKALTPAQVARLQALLVQDMGYGALRIGAVRSQLALTTEQAKAMEAIVANLETTRRALTGVSAQADAEVQAQTSAALAKLLTTEQDAKLRSLAGSPLGTKPSSR